MRRFTCALAVMLGSPVAIADITCVPSDEPAIQPRLLWDNMIIQYWVNAHAMSPPAFPDIRLADDFMIRDEAWLITGWQVVVIEDASWTRGEIVELRLYEGDDGPLPRGLERLLTTGFEATFQGFQIFNRDVFSYRIRDASLALERGHYWGGMRNPDGGGMGTNYSIEMDCCCADACGTHPNAYSLDAGETWVSHGLHFAFFFRVFGYRAVTRPPSGLEVTAGERVAGGLESLLADDGDHLVIDTSSRAEVVLEATWTGAAPPAIGFSLDGFASGPATETIDLYDFTAGAYVRLHEAAAEQQDRKTDVIIEETVRDFIEAGTGRVRARVAYDDQGAGSGAFMAGIDQAVWRVGRGCPPDLDDDGVVGFNDLLVLLAAWGNDGGPEDLDGSGTVDFGDIVVLLAAWGLCG